jgi:hypothetical protein
MEFRMLAAEALRGTYFYKDTARRATEAPVFEKPRKALAHRTPGAVASRLCSKERIIVTFIAHLRRRRSQPIKIATRIPRCPNASPDFVPQGGTTSGKLLFLEALLALRSPASEAGRSRVDSPAILFAIHLHQRPPAMTRRFSANDFFPVSSSPNPVSSF